MIKKILDALHKEVISVYQITESRRESIELFFIKKKLDMRRGTDIVDYAVTVFRDFEVDGTKYRGSASVCIPNGMTQEQINQKLKDAYYAASFAKNKWYPIPSGTCDNEIKEQKSNLSNNWKDYAMKTAEAVYSVDTDENVFINSLEIFVRRSQTHILNSEGIDVCYCQYKLQGEFVAQCLEPQDVETYEDFEYDNFDAKQIKEKVQRILQLTRDRALATKAPEAGEYNVILSGKYVPVVLEYYAVRSNAAMMFQGYSNYHLEDDVQMAGSEDEVVGEKLNITLKATAPYSGEGIAMKDMPLLKDGCLKTVHGGTRFCYYMGVAPTGMYDKFEVSAGKTSFEKMKSGKYLHVVNFSDFQMDSFSGNFAGEIRLAYLCDGDKVSVVTGGSINGSIIKAQKNFVFSSEVQSDTQFTGPLAIRMEKVLVAGQTEG